MDINTSSEVQRVHIRPPELRQRQDSEIRLPNKTRHENDAGSKGYNPTTTIGNGYDTYEERMRSVAAKEAEWGDWVLEISISDSMHNNLRARLDDELGIN